MVLQVMFILLLCVMLCQPKKNSSSQSLYFRMGWQGVRHPIQLFVLNYLLMVLLLLQSNIGTIHFENMQHSSSLIYWMQRWLCLHVISLEQRWRKRLHWGMDSLQANGFWKGGHVVASDAVATPYPSYKYIPIILFQGLMDLNKPILSGHSFGSATTLRTLAVDTRFKSV